MGLLTDFHNQATEAKQKDSAGLLINSVIKLKAQFAEVKTTITTLQAKIKADVGNDVWSLDDLTDLHSALTLFQGIKRKGKARRAELLGMQLLLTDNDHKTELQTEVDNLDIPE